MIHLEREGVPRLVAASFIFFILVFVGIGWFFCRRKGRRTRLRLSPNTGFQKINSTEAYTDSEEDDIQFDK